MYMYYIYLSIYIYIYCSLAPPPLSLSLARSVFPSLLSIVLSPPPARSPDPPSPPLPVGRGMVQGSCGSYWFIQGEGCGI